MNNRSDQRQPGGHAVAASAGREQARQIALSLVFALIGLLIGAAGAFLTT